MKRRITFEAWIDEEDAERFLLTCHRDGLTPGAILEAVAHSMRPGNVILAEDYAKLLYSCLAWDGEKRPTFPQWLDRGGRLEDADRLATKAEGILEQIDILLGDGIPADDAEVLELRAKERDALEPLARMFEEYKSQTGTPQEFRAGLAEMNTYLLEAEVMRRDLRKMEGREDD